MAVYKQTLKLSRLSGSLSAAYYNQKVTKIQYVELLFEFLASHTFYNMESEEA